MKPPAGARPKGEPKRSAWWTVHHWAGLKLSLLLTFVMATGTLATVAHELDWLLRPSMRVAVQDRPYAGWGAWVEAVRSVAPDPVEEIDAPLGRGFAVDVAFEDAERRVQVDPWTARVTGVTGYFTIQRALRETHRHLMLPTDVGLPIVSVLSLPLLALFATAFVVYKKWWRGFRRVPKAPKGRRGDGRRFAGDLHRWLGLWSLPFLLLMGLSGLWYFVEWGGGEAPKIQKPELAAAAPPDAAAIDAAVAKAQAAYPALRVRGLRFPEDGGVIVVGQAQALLVRDDANAVFWDVATNRAAGVVDARTMSAHQRLSEAADPLHFGNWGGLASKLVWFVFGAALTVLSATGAVIYVARLRLAGVVQGMIRPWLAGAGIGGWLSVALSILALALLIQRIFAG